jgi:hypothetical protein
MSAYVYSDIKFKTVDEIRANAKIKAMEIITSESLNNKIILKDPIASYDFTNDNAAEYITNSLLLNESNFDDIDLSITTKRGLIETILNFSSENRNLVLRIKVYSPKQEDLNDIEIILKESLAEYDVNYYHPL